MTNLITEARELIEDLHDGRWEYERIDYCAYEKLVALCDALENTEKQLQEQFDKTGAWLEEYNEMKIALEKAERESGCEWCADNYDHRHKTMFRKGSDWNYEAKYCDMCGKRLEEHHEAD